MGNKGSGWFRTDLNKLNEEEIRQRYLDNHEAMMSIANSFGVSINTLKPLFKKWKIEIRDGKGKNHSQWKGGKQIIQGYSATYLPNHPRARKNGYLFDHIIEMEKKIGKSVGGKHPIHHIDFDKLNNCPENLWLCENEKEHRDIHCSLDYVARELFKKGIIKFKDGRYYA